jgi:hypothetical protein
MPLFGTRSTKYILDDQVRDVMNVWNHARPQRARCDEQKERVVVTIDPHPSLKDGFSRHSFFFKDVDGERVLVWEQYVRTSRRGESGRGRSGRQKRAPGRELQRSERQGSERQGSGRKGSER